MKDSSRPKPFSPFPFSHSSTSFLPSIASVDPHSQLLSFATYFRDARADDAFFCASTPPLVSEFDASSSFVNALPDPEFVFVEASRRVPRSKNLKSRQTCRGDKHVRRTYGRKTFPPGFRRCLASLSVSHQQPDSQKEIPSNINSVSPSQGSNSQPSPVAPRSSRAPSVDHSIAIDAEKGGIGFRRKDGTKSAQSDTVLEKAWIGAAAGGFAGAFTYTCLHPLDTIKTKLQTRGASNIYSGSLDVILKVLQREGILGFYSGISAVLVGSTMSSAVFFGTCEFGKAFLARMSVIPPLFIPPLAGAIGNIVSSSILVPKEVITQKMQAGAAGRSWQVFVRILESEGLKGLYVGYSAALLRNLPNSVLNFSTFEYLKGAWLASSKRTSLEPWQSVTSGAIAGAIAATLTTPLDVVKTRLMTQSTTSIPLRALKSKVAGITYKGVSSTLKQIWIEEGWVGLTRGVGPRLLHSACFSALGFFAFETARLEIGRHLVKIRVSEDLKVPSPSEVIS